MTGNKNKVNDVALVDRILNENDQIAYATLMNKYKKAVFFTVLKMVSNKDDAEDITMLTFTKAFKSLPQYNTEFAFTTWLFRIASNNAIDHLRKKRLKTTSLDIDFNSEDDDKQSLYDSLKTDQVDPEEKMVIRQRNRIMAEVINSLDEKYSTLIKMYYFEELKYEEIADRLAIPLGTVKVRLKRAKDFLAKLLEEHKEKY